jgi:hypothetical protein
MTGRHVAKNDRIGANVDVVADRYRAEQYRPGADINAVTDAGRFQRTIKRSVPDGNALPHHNVVADDGVVMNNDATKMLDYHSTSDLCIHADLDAEKNLRKF